MDDVAYERHVTGLELAHENSINDCAKSAVRDCGSDESYDFKHAAAYDAVSGMLFASPAWEDVQATDISDIAYEAATKAADETLGEDHDD